MLKSIFLRSLIVCTPLCLATSACCNKGVDLIYSRKSDMKDGGHTSPDGKFVVVSKVGEGESGYIALYEKSNLRRVIYKDDSIDGFAWLPGRDHSLVFAVSSDNNGQTPGLFLWQGGKHPRLIKGVTGAYHKWPGVALLGVSRDGHKIAYYYWPNLMGTNPKRFGPFVKSMRLP